MVQQQAGVTLFDLDGVLTRHDTMAALIVQRLKQKPLRILGVLPLFVIAAIAGARRGVAAKANRLAVRLTFAGLAEQEYRALAATEGQRMATRSGFIREGLIELCRERQKSSRVVIVTASEVHLVEAFLTACGLSNIELIASHLDFSTRVPRVKLHNVGSQKIRSLRMAGVLIENATFYTDSASDLPLALVAARTVIVHPSKRSRRLLLAALPGAQLIE
ncbi:haloacid dehalogenase-like hydrolase [Arthrobacter echini]|uniref:Haloacid dehalogenase-like hydrolase n=1 Tax=Arthrobacter echini TaxID=1529066 RepID=A0A5D0XQT2_9MICC|nr:haloacid dehalogenase-like hydrolase [Arthrobacter echini]